MSNFKTTWVLDFVETITSPLKNMMKNFNQVSRDADEFGKSVQFSQQEATEALRNTKEDFNNLKKSIRENEL